MKLWFNTYYSAKLKKNIIVQWMNLELVSECQLPECQLPKCQLPKCQLYKILSCITPVTASFLLKTPDSFHLLDIWVRLLYYSVCCASLLGDYCCVSHHKFKVVAMITVILSMSQSSSWHYQDFPVDIFGSWLFGSCAFCKKMEFRAIEGCNKPRQLERQSMSYTVANLDITWQQKLETSSSC